MACPEYEKDLVDALAGDLLAQASSAFQVYQAAPNPDPRLKAAIIRTINLLNKLGPFA